MRTRIDVAAAGQTAEGRALLDRLDDSGVISLGVLSGADLCMSHGRRLLPIPSRGAPALLTPAFTRLMTEVMTAAQESHAGG
jgi:hypothetical protein